MARRLLAALFVVGCAVVVRAQERPVLHEYVPDVGPDEEVSLVTGDGPEPEAIVYEGEVLPAPEGGGLRADERPMMAVPGNGVGNEEEGRRSPSFRPDRMTSLEGTLGYYEVFSPAVAPFKRVTALDTVVLGEDGRTPVLVVGQLSTTPVPVESPNSLPPDDRPRDRFWGNVVVDFSAGRMVPIPSVSPESRILSLRTEPQSRLRIEIDGADNYFAVDMGDGPGGQVRIVFLTDAPQGYFNTEIPDVLSDALSADVPPLPSSVQEQVDRFVFELGLSRGLPLRHVLDRLVEHFRSFEEAEEPPEDSGQIYLDLARGMRGVCRHRAYAFTITALGLGIPTRFVQNEAHAWVEVEMAGFGWMRIDLGGAARGLDAHGTNDGPVYRPRAPDPLPRPEPYEQAYAQLRRNVEGLEGGGRLEGDDPGGAPEEEGPDEGEGEGEGGEGEPGSPVGPGGPGPVGPGGASMSDESGRLPLIITSAQRRYEVFRGHTLDVTGQVADLDGEGVPGMRIEVLLRGEDHRERLIGVTVTRDHGWFRGSFGVPPDQIVGDYTLLIRTPGDEHFAPAMAR